MLMYWYFTVSRMGILDAWGCRFPRGLPFGFSRDLVSDDLKRLRYFADIDIIASESRGSAITVILHSGPGIELLVRYLSPLFGNMFTIQSPLVAIEMTRLDEEDRQRSIAKPKPIVEAATKSKKAQILWDPAKPTQMDGWVVMRKKERNDRIVLKSVLLQPNPLLSFSTWEHVEKV